MKSKSLILFFSGVAVGATAGLLFTPQKSLKAKKDVLKKSKKYKKAFKESASKYK